MDYPTADPRYPLGYEQNLDLGVTTPAQLGALWNAALANTRPGAGRRVHGLDQIQQLWLQHWSQGGSGMPQQAAPSQGYALGGGQGVMNPAGTGGPMVGRYQAPVSVPAGSIPSQQSAAAGFNPVPTSDLAMYEAQQLPERLQGALTSAPGQSDVSGQSQTMTDDIGQPTITRPKSDAVWMGLLSAGLGILAHNKGPYGASSPAIGAGGLIGVNTMLQQRQLEQEQLYRQEAIQQRWRALAQQQQLQNAQIADYQAQAEQRRLAAEMTKRTAAGIAAAYGGGAQQAAGGGQQVAPQGAPGPTGAAPQGAPAPAGMAPQAGVTSDPVFDPNLYANIARSIASHGGDPNESLKFANLAKEMAGLQLQGFHTVDLGNGQLIMRGGQVQGFWPKGMSLDQKFTAVRDMVTSQREAINTEFITGQRPPTLGGTPEQPQIGKGGPSQGMPAPQTGGAPVGGPNLGSDDPRNVFKGIPPKDTAELVRQQVQQGRQDLQKENDTLPQAQEAARAAQRFMELNAETATGRIIGSGPAAGVRAAVPRNQSAKNLQEMQKIQAQLQATANLMRSQGNISNFERQISGRANAAVDNEREVNDDINKITIQGAVNAEQRIAFKEWFLNRYQTTNQSDRWWADYINGNPTYITKSKAEPRLVINEAKMSWQDYAEQRAGGAKPIPLLGGMYRSVGNNAGGYDFKSIDSNTMYITPGGPMKGDALKKLMMSLPKE